MSIKLAKHARYMLHVRGDQSYSVRHPDGTTHFTAPVTESCPKLYLVGNDAGLHYVGIAVQGMAARLRLGFKAAGEHGYYGYAWRHLRTPLALHVWCATSTDGPVSRQELEALEAEVVYLCRNVTGQWPLSQTEIHFRPIMAKHTSAARLVYEDFVATNVLLGVSG